MAVDIPKRILKSRSADKRRELHSDNPGMKKLHELYSFLTRRTSSLFNKNVSKRLTLSKRNKAPLKISRIAYLMRNQKGGIACVVGTVTDDINALEIPKLTVCALRFTESARRKIIANGGECLTFDTLALRCPTGSGCILLRGHTKHREAEKHFGKAPGLTGSHTKPYNCPKVSH